VERSITQPAAGDGSAAAAARDVPSGRADEILVDQPVTAHSAALIVRLGRNKTVWGIALILVCLLVYGASHPDRTNPYIHFVLQAQAWLGGNTSIVMPGYQDVMPLGIRADGSSCVVTSSDPTCVSNGLGIIPFPPLPAWVLLPFVSVWGLATNEQLLAVVFAAIDVGIAFWMLGYLPIRPRVQVLTSAFLGLGTVLWYAAAIGTTWFWAHIVAVGCLLLSVGLALSADRDATDPQPVSGLLDATREILHWPAGRWSVAALASLAADTAVLFVVADRGWSAAEMTVVGIVLGVLAAALAVIVAERPGVLATFAIAVALVGGVPALIIAGSQSADVSASIELVLATLLVVVWWTSLRQSALLLRGLKALWAMLSSPEARQVAAGLLFGLAVTARLTILFGFPFLILVGGGGNWLRRGMLAGAGVAVPLVALLVYTYAATGQLFNPAYQYQYGVELVAYGNALNYNSSWSITDVRYIPQNLGIMLFSLPSVMPTTLASVFPGYGDPACVATTARGLFDTSCPLAYPQATGMSILLTSPAFLLAPLAWRPIRRLRIDRLTAGATIAVLAIALVNLMHFSQGWVQFGYRFSNDFVPFALILVALGASRLGRLWPVVLLVGLSILVNFWGTLWGVNLGW